MDYTFPNQLFPHFYLDGPPDLDLKHDYGGCGSYQKLLETTNETAQCGTERQIPFKFQPQHKVEGEAWIPTEPVVTPFLPPNEGTKVISATSVSPGEFPDHMQYFYVHHCMDSFSTMGKLLSGHFSFGKNSRKGCVRMGRLNDFLNNLNYKKCEQACYSKRVTRYHHLLSDILPDIPSSLLSNLLHEELTYQSNLKHFQPAAAGGALGCFPMQNKREVCLIYPSGEALSVINFHRVVLDYTDSALPTLKMVKKPLVWNLNGTIRQVSVARVDDEAYVGLRSDYYCASWGMKDGHQPHPLEVVQLKECSTCINVSPHLSGEYVVASESGAAYLWTVGKGLQRIRDEKSNLYFDARSSWRWCDFTAHPRVMVYADQTGAELTDMRSSDSHHTLFQIGKAANCKTGERVILTKYLMESHAYHHLITTQYSTYIMDERMPRVPALKWEHMMESPPCFAQVVPPLGKSSTSKILLGASTAQDTIMLQYSGGRLWPCQAHGPVQKLCSPSESLKVVQLPHRRHKAEQRLGVPAAGLAAVQSDRFLCVLQCTEMGDVFYQMLRHFDPTNSDSDKAFSASSAPQHPVPMEEARELDGEPHLRPETVVEHSFASDGEEWISSEPGIVPGSSMHSVQINSAHPLRPANPEMASKQLKVIWKKWLETLLNAVTKKRHLRHRQIKTADVMRFKSCRKDKLEKDKFQHLRKDLSKSLKTGKLLAHGVTYLPPLEVMPLPDVVSTVAWPDDLSQRLSASWGDGWQEWWVEKLGLNRDYKIEALRRKRYREKRSRARNRVALSGSFTSSISYQDTLSEWSSAASQYLGSDSESVVNYQSAAENDVLSEPEMLAENSVLHGESMNTECPIEEPEETQPVLKNLTQPPEQDQVTISPKKRLPGHSFSAETDSSMADVSKPSPSSQRKPTWRRQDYLSSLFGSEELSQDVEQDGGSAVPMSQLSSFSFVSQGSSKFRASSQASQPQKKKSRMGF